MDNQTNIKTIIKTGKLEFIQNSFKKYKNVNTK